MENSKAMNWWLAAVGAWVAIAPFALNYSGAPAALWNDLIVGVAVAILAAVAATSEDRDKMTTVNWMIATLGLWLLLAPFILGYAGVTAALWNDLIAAAVSLVLSLGAERELGSLALPF